ncbi:MAG: hypothetical protein ACREYC_26365 [Gammaproteobacteria bacterium]
MNRIDRDGCRLPDSIRDHDGMRFLDLEVLPTTFSLDDVKRKLKL